MRTVTRIKIGGSAVWEATARDDAERTRLQSRRIGGSSKTSVEDAIENALARAAETLRNLDWFEVRETRGRVVDGRVGWYQVTLGIGFRVEDGAAVAQD